MSTFATDTSKRNFKNWLIALSILLIGLIIAHLGISLFLLAELGTDTFTVFIQGLARTFNLSVGTFHVIVLCILLIIMLLMTKGYVKPGTILCAFCGGPIIDFFTWLLNDFINADSTLWWRIICMILGCIILSIGMSIVIKSNAGTGPNDLIAIILTDKLRKFQFRWVRMTCDLCFVILGYFLGGTVGIGTVVGAFLTGPLVQYWLPKSEFIIKLILKE